MFDLTRHKQDSRERKLLQFWLVLLSVAICLGVSGYGVAAEEEKSADQRIAEALLPLPEPLRAGATVVLDREPGKREVLRKGTNHIICRADTPAPGFTVRCHHRDLDALSTRIEELRAEGVSWDRFRDTIDAEIRSGKLKTFAGATRYMLAGSSPVTALPLMEVFLPGATSESTGLPVELSNYRPWLMWAGTAAAHIMIPGK